MPLLSNTINFPKLYNKLTGKTNLATNVKSINQSLALLLTTNRGELLGDPDYGCDLYTLLFNPINSSLVAMLQRDILQAIATYENRITLTTDDIHINSDDIAIKISIVYTIKMNNEKAAYKLALNRE